jgi:hypothetical protein
VRSIISINGVIAAVEIVDNLKKCPPLVDTLPTSERQIRSLKSLPNAELQRQDGKVTQPNEGINYVPGVGVEWYIRVDDATWNSLNEYALRVGAATLGGAIARLLEANF